MAIVVTAGDLKKEASSVVHGGLILAMLVPVILSIFHAPTFLVYGCVFLGICATFNGIGMMWHASRIIQKS